MCVRRHFTMGIEAMWPLLTAKERVQARGGKLEGKRVGVDMSVLMHVALGLPNVATAMVIHGEASSTVAVTFVKTQVELFRKFKAVPVAFFDGKHTQAKAKENQSRATKRLEAARQAKDHYARDERKEAARKAAEATHVTPELRRDIIAMCRSLEVEVVGAPGEADGQLAWEARKGTIDFVYTTDGDLVALGCCVLRPADPKHPFKSLQSGSLDLYYVAEAALGPQDNASAEPSPPAGPDLTWMTRTYGRAVLLWWAGLVGCDFNESESGGKGVSGVNASTAWKVLCTVAKESGAPATTWSDEAVVAALRANLSSRRVRDDGSIIEMLRRVRHSFQQHLVCIDRRKGTLGLLSGEPLSCAHHPDPIGTTKGELVRRWCACEADPNHPHVRYSWATHAVPQQPPSQLDLEMVNAQLYTPAESANVEQLKTFLKSHNLPIAENKPELVRLVRLMQAENKKYGIMHVRDPDSKLSLGKHLLEQGYRTAKELPQYDEQLTPPDEDDSAWNTSRADVEARAPLLSKERLLEWAEDEEYVYTVNGETRLGESYKRGVSRCTNNPNFTLAMTPPAIDHHGRSIVWLREQVPRMQEVTGHRLVHVCVEVACVVDSSGRDSNDSCKLVKRSIGSARVGTMPSAHRTTSERWRPSGRRRVSQSAAQAARPSRRRRG